MRRGRGKLPVLAEVSGFEPGSERLWSLREPDFQRLAALQDRLAPTRRLLVCGAAELAAPLAVALAAAAGAVGRRTVLVECEVERPRLAAELGLEEAPGLHEYLRWEATPEEVLQPLALLGPAARDAGQPLVFIAAGRPAPQPATLFGLQSFEHMTAKLGRAYDLVVMARTGLGEGDGALAALAARADGLLLALAPGGASGKAGRGLRAALAELPVPALGAVLVGAR